MAQETFVRVCHPASKALHWRRPGEAMALCQACVPAGRQWQAPFAGALYTWCAECDRAIWCWVRGAGAVTLALPNAREAAP